MGKMNFIFPNIILFTLLFIIFIIIFIIFMGQNYHMVTYH